jgi:hypothetical protein
MATETIQPARYRAQDHIRDHLRDAADEGALFIRRLLRGEIENTADNRALGTEARAALGAFTRYEATLSARDQTSVVVSKLLAGDNREAFEDYVRASLPAHPAVRAIPARIIEPKES